MNVWNHNRISSQTQIKLATWCAQCGNITCIFLTSKRKRKRDLHNNFFLLHFTRQVMIEKISDILSHILKHGFVLQKNSKSIKLKKLE